MLDAAIRSLITRIKRCDVGKARWVLRRCLLLEERFETVDATEQARITEALSASYTALKLAAAEKRDGKAIDEAFKVAASRIEECCPCQPQEELPDDQKRIQSLKAAMEHVTSKVPVNNIVKPLEVALTVVHSDPPKQDTLLYNLSENSGYDLQDIIFLARLKQPKMPERVPRFFQRELRRHRFTPEGSQFQRLKKLSHKIDTLPQAPTGGVGLHMVTTSPDFVLLVVGESNTTPDSFAMVNKPREPITNALPQHQDKRRVFRHYLNGGWTYDYKPQTQASETWQDLKAAGRLKFNKSEWVVQIS